MSAAAEWLTSTETGIDMNSKYSSSGSSPAERVLEASSTEVTGKHPRTERNRAGDSTPNVKETLRFHKQKPQLTVTEPTDVTDFGLTDANLGASSSVNSQGSTLNVTAPPPGLTEQDRTDRLRCFPTLLHACCPHLRSCRYCEATCCRTDPDHTSHRCRVHLHW